MILFAGIPSEPPLALAIAAAERAGAPHIVFNQRHAAHCGLHLDWGAAGLGGEITLGGAPIALAALTGIYARMGDVGVMPEHRPRGRTPADPVALARARIISGLFDEVLDTLPTRVVNRPATMGSNLSKPAQAQAITAVGLLTPPTLVTNRPEAVRAFHAEQGRIIFKSVSAVRSIVREWSPDAGPDLDSVTRLPTQFQGYVPGVNIRVHVIGGAVFATEIVSDAVDYRYGERDGLDTAMAPMVLADDIAEACVRLTARLGLTMSGIDLKRTPDGTIYCFEVNPSPAYSYFEEHGGQPIAAALVAHLGTRV